MVLAFLTSIRIEDYQITVRSKLASFPAGVAGDGVALVDAPEPLYLDRRVALLLEVVPVLEGTPCELAHQLHVLGPFPVLRQHALVAQHPIQFSYVDFQVLQSRVKVGFALQQVLVYVRAFEIVCVCLHQLVPRGVHHARLVPLGFLFRSRLWFVWRDLALGLELALASDGLHFGGAARVGHAAAFEAPAGVHQLSDVLALSFGVLCLFFRHFTRCLQHLLSVFSTWYLFGV